MEYVRCVCIWLGTAWVERVMRGLGLGFTNPVGAGRVLDVVFGCGGVGRGLGPWSGVVGW